MGDLESICSVQHWVVVDAKVTVICGELVKYLNTRGEACILSEKSN